MERRPRPLFALARERSRNNTLVHRGHFSGCFAPIDDGPEMWRLIFAAQLEWCKECGELIPIGEESMQLGIDHETGTIVHLHGEPTAQPRG